MHPLFARLALLLGATVLLSGSFSATPQVQAISALRELKTSGEPFAIAIDAATGRAYATDTRENTLFVFDLATGEALAHVPTGRQPGQVVLLAGRAYVSNFADATITVVDTATNRAIKIIQAGGLGLAVDAAKSRLYAAGATRITVLDTTADKLVATIAAPSGANVWGLALDASSRRLYVTDIASPRLLAYDLDTNTLVAEIAIDAPARFGIATAGGRVFVASYTDHSPQLLIIDAASAKVTGRAAIAMFTTSLAVKPNASVVYAASSLDRSVMAIDPATRNTVATTRLTLTSGGVAVNPISGELFVTTAGGAPPPPRVSGDVVPVVKP
jgi:YVTN family beta-propeller protein